MKIAISGEVPAQGYSFNDLLWIIKSLRVSAIELWPENIPYEDGSCPYTRSYAQRDLAKASKLLEKYSISACCVSFGGAFDSGFTVDKERYVQELKMAIDAAHVLGAGFVNSYLYHLSMDENPDLEYLYGLYAPAVEEAEKKGVVLLLENEAHDSTRNPVIMRNIIQRIGSPFFRANFDAVNYHQSSYECFPYSFDVLHDCFSYIHIKDGCIFDPDNPMHNPLFKGGRMTGANEGKYIYYPMMGQGTFNIPAEIEALRSSGYDGYVTLEPHVPIEYWPMYITHEVQYLKRLGLE